MTPITVAVLETREVYLQQGLAESLEAINQGLCADFAADVIQNLGDATAALVQDVSVASFQAVEDDDFADGRPFDRKLLAAHWPHVVPPKGLTWDDLDRLSADAGFGDGTHVWLTDDALHYDSECPEGVGNFFELPFFQRAVASWQAERTLTTKSQTSVSHVGM